MAIEIVRGKLNAARKAVFQVAKVPVGVLGVSLAGAEAQNQLEVTGNAQERVLFAPRGIRRFVVFLLAVDKGVKLIGLNILGVDVADGFVVEVEATRANGFQDVQDGLLVQARQSGSCPNAHSLTQQADNLGNLVRGDSDAFEGLRFAECSAANRATEAPHDAVSILERGEELGLAGQGAFIAAPKPLNHNEE
jgi:hypothetical protein